MPASAFKFRTANASNGVGKWLGKRSAWPPAALITSAASVANSADPWRASWPITTTGADPMDSVKYDTRPAVALMTTDRFIRDSPVPISPRKPAVPNCSGPEKRAANSSMFRVLMSSRIVSASVESTSLSAHFSARARISSYVESSLSEESARPSRTARVPESPRRFAPAAIISSAFSAVRIPPDALTPMSGPTVSRMRRMA